MEPNQQTTLDRAVACAQDAGILLKDAWQRRLTDRRELTITTKASANDLVTEHDQAAEALIIKTLRAAFPDYAILAEESGGDAADPDQPRWVIDPLDGTTNFAHGLPFFSVSIGLQVGGRPLLGVVHAPLLGFTFAARRGHGATLNGAPLRVSRTAALSEALLATGFPVKPPLTLTRDNFEPFTILQRRCHGVRRVGSAALDLSMVAAGWLDGFWEQGLSPWDICAGIVLVEEAGGVTSNWRGGPAGEPMGEIIACNGQPALHEEVLKVLASFQILG